MIVLIKKSNMETNINVAEILKNKSCGTKLYSSAFGQMTYNGIIYDKNGTEVWLLTENEVDTLYLSDGKYREGGEVTLYPSKEMRDWSKFAWKRGDVLVSDDGCIEVIFDKWYDDTYTSFYCKHYLDSEDENDIKYLEEFICSTWKYSLEDTESFLCYVTNIEDRLGGKLNLKTLEIEKNPASFKDGDIVVTDPSRGHSKCIFILKGGLNACESHASSYVYYNIDSNFISFGIVDRTIRDRNIHLATVEEKLELFDALTKEGKYWDAEKKEVIDLKPKIRFKPFDKIVALEKIGREWVCDMFSHYSKDYKGKETIVGIGGLTYSKAVPFNEKTAKLIGTTKEWKE